MQDAGDSTAEPRPQRARAASASSSEGDWRACVEYETKRVRVGDLDVLVFQMEELPVAASLFMLAEMDANDTEISGKRLWTGSHVLSRYLWRHPELVRGKRVLELGAGTGICSIVAAKLGAEHCLATDGDAEVVALLAQNVEVNGAAVAQRMATHSLFWGDEASAQTLLAQFPDALSAPDVLLAGDVLYKRELLPLLFATVTRVLRVESSSANSQAQGQGQGQGQDGAGRAFVLCHIPRADVTHDVVQAQIAASGLQFTEVTLPAEDVAAASDELEECPLEDVERAKLYYITQAQAELEG